VTLILHRTMMSLAVIGIMQQVGVSQKPPDSAPTILDLGSNVNNGSVSLACTGDKPYAKLSCKVYRLSIARPTPDVYQKSRTALQKELATTGEADLLRKMHGQCSTLPSDLGKNLTNYSPGRAASARDGYEQMKAVCSCTTKQCITSIMLEQQTHEQNECTVSSTVFSADFVKVGERKWVSNNGPEGICGVVSVFTIEHEPTATDLWTYTEQYIYTNNTADWICKLAHNETSTYSWQSGNTVRLKCDDFKFETLPEQQ
jgi:hypothetical protein